MELIQLNRDPRINEFSKEDLVLNTVTGDLFAKTGTKLLKIASRNTNTGLSTDDVLKLIPPSSDKNTILTDILEYKEVGINKSNSGSFLTEFIAGGKSYYNLDLSRIQAMFVRLDDEFMFPIGTITPPTIIGRAHTIYIESGPSDDGGHFLARPPVNALSLTEVHIDDGDLLRESFTTRTVGGVEYDNTLKINTGCRAMLVRSRFDWKVQSLSDFSEVTASFTTLNATNISASGHISASVINIGGGTFTSASLAAGGSGGGGTSNYNELNNIPSGIYSSSLQTLGNITSSGNISSSGIIRSNVSIISNNLSVPLIKTPFNNANSFVVTDNNDQPFIHFANSIEDQTSVLILGDKEGTGNETLIKIDDANELITANRDFEITKVTDATDASGDTGALRVEGGASIAKKVFIGTQLSVGSHITSSGNISASGTVVANSFVGTLTGTATGLAGTPNITVGTIEATSLNVTNITSSIVTSSIIQTEGSNIFGDTINDTQTFNGHITASGDISASGTVTANSIVGTLSTAAQTNITSVGTLSSLTISNDIIHSGDTDTKISFGTDSITFKVGNVDMVALSEGSNDTITFGNSATDVIVPGNLSSSGTIFADTYEINGKKALTEDGGEGTLFQDISSTGTINLGKPNLTPSIFVNGPITASNNISSSGNLIGDDLQLGGEVGLLSSANLLTIANTTGGELNTVYFKTAKVGIGINTPATALDVSGDISASGAFIANTIKSPTNNLIVSSSTVRLTATTDGEANLILEADSDNNDENDNPFMSLLQDGGGIEGQIGISGDADKWPDGNTLTGASINSMVIGMKGTTSGNNRELIFATANAVALKLDNEQSAHFVNDIYLPNNVQIQGTETGGTTRFMLFMDTSNIVNIGASNNPLSIRANSVGVSFNSNITASGEISASSNLVGQSLFIDSSLIHNGDTDTRVQFSADDHIDLQTNGSVRARINNDGVNVNSGRLNVNSNITASGNISSSGIITANTIQTLGTTANNVISPSLSVGNFPIATANVLRVGGASQFDSHITASGDISSSGTITGDSMLSAGRFYLGGFGGTNPFIASTTAGIEIKNGSLEVDSHITASGDISASGDIIANTGSFNHLIMVDGEFIGHSIIATDTDESPPAGIALKDANSISIAGLARLGSGDNAHRGQLFLRDNSDGSATLKVQIKAHGDSYFNGTSVQVGIGNDSPGKELDVTGEIRASGNIIAQGASSVIQAIDTTQNYIVELGGFDSGPKINWGDNDSSTDSFMTMGAFSAVNQIDTANRDFHIYGTNTTTGFYFDESAGKFGVGTTTPPEELTIEGNISASGTITAASAKINTRELGYSEHVDTSFAQGDIVSFGNSPVIAGGVYALTGSGTYHGAQANIGALSTGSLAVALTTNSSGGMLLRGVVKMQASYNGSGTNVGVPVYLSTNSTRMNTNPPTGTGEIVRILGHHLSGSQTMYFNPDNSFIVLS